jgi:2',3'-cyclic-nucleotide 2'-phosphodiesterase (5'-nucleotidase family)
MRDLRILHTSDHHGVWKPQVVERLRELRQSCDIYIDTGDIGSCGNLIVPLSSEKGWKVLDQLSCTAGVPGNRDIHIFEWGLRKKLAGLGHPLLCCNLFDRETEELVFPASTKVEKQGSVIGLVGAMLEYLPSTGKKTLGDAASRYAWTEPGQAVTAEVQKLRSACDQVFLLSHCGIQIDRQIASSVEGVDAIFSGHSHRHEVKPEEIGRTIIFETGAFGKRAGIYTLTEHGWIIEWCPLQDLVGKG